MVQSLRGGGKGMEEDEKRWEENEVLDVKRKLVETFSLRANVILYSKRGKNAWNRIRYD